ncbi:peptidase S11 [Moraxella bovoculi]|uniref:Peptidase S11 n=1 Tax=Moraxella bovoculi TaxID=386891 RepID=A0AAC8PW13_9GAMM|nr:serine hydrolase [Moraxella bovoculi]AKG07871.1 peptidase S11 [Moraxella bovoculi]AKG09592.1 peptidase S11 [Moraxella bovoculi]AKG11408.1 peptidase S11 [Moraxella bovoculi]AKG13416.1 peptidase S11 [Moraxella bovoculi]
MKNSKLMKRASTQIAVLALMTSGASANAFTVDSSNQRTVTVTRATPSVTTTVTRAVPTPPPSNTVKTTKTITPATAPTVSYRSQLTQTTYNVPTYTAPATPVAPATIMNTVNANHYNAPVFDQLAISTNSSAVAVLDLQSGDLIYSKNIDATRSIASVTKVMTAMVILDAGLDMREDITIIPSDLVGAKKASTNLRAGDRLSRSEFTLMMLMKSENPAAKALARTYPGGYNAFIRAMNDKAASLGMYQTSFSDSSGLDPRNVASANDLVKMMKAVSEEGRYQLIRNFSTAPSYDFYITNFNSGNRTYKANNTSRLVRSGGHPIGVSKTGFIREAGYCVVMETHVNNKPAVIVLLGANASQSRWNDAENILTELAYRR